MYKIEGGDHWEYGPVSLDQVIQWINEGRADAQTRALPDGALEWKPLAALPEFAAALAAKTAQAASPPPIVTPPPMFDSFDSRAMSDRVLARGVIIDPIRCISRSWDLLMRHFWLLFGATLVINLLDGAVPIIHGALFGGLYLLFLKLIRGQRAEFGDAFGGFSERFLQLFLVGLVSGILTLVGYVFCIVPGIYLTVAWMFVIPLVVDKRMDFWPAMEVSLRVIQRNWFQFFLLGILNILVVMLGFLALCVGIYVALPITIGAVAYAYEDVFGAEPPAPPKPL